MEFSPTLKKLASMMDNIAVQLTSCLSVFQRLPDILTKKRSVKDVSATRFLKDINHTVTKNLYFVSNYLHKYKLIIFILQKVANGPSSWQLVNFCVSFALLQRVCEIIERDEETKKIQASIKAGMSANASHLQSYLSTWDRYESLEQFSIGC